VNIRGYSGKMLLTFFTLTSSTLTAWAQDPDYGATLYRQHCASCHGERANGNGPLAPALTVKPTDLRTITTRHQGDFPRDLLKRIIGGDEVIAAHGSRVMPIWGERLQEDVLGTVSKPVVARGRIGFLIDYLETLQGTDIKDFDNVVLPTTGVPPRTKP
jgi:mono/diheme cytochrome c family protein